MFGLALWDAREHRLLVARDRLGKKPLVYYADAHGGLAFASELQALLAHPSVPREVDPRAIDDYLTYLYVPAPTTAYRNVKKLPPGHRLVWQAGHVTVEPYWQVHFAQKQNLSEPQAIEQFGTPFKHPVRPPLNADLPPAALFIGGIDSKPGLAAIAALSP